MATVKKSKKTNPPSVRAAMVTRDNGRCRACGIGDIDALQCDHIVPESKGGNGSLGNLQSLCGVCNNRKGSVNIGELPIREKMEGLGNLEDVMRGREIFGEMISMAREAEYTELTNRVEQLRKEGLRGWVIRNRLGKIAHMGTVERIMKKGREGR